MRLRDVTNWVARHASLLVMIVAVIVGTAYYQQIRQIEARERCQAEYNVAMATQLVKRSEINSASDKVKSDLLGGVAKLFVAKAEDQDEAERRAEAFRTLLREYRDESARVIEMRARTPLPDIPACYDEAERRALEAEARILLLEASTR